MPANVSIVVCAASGDVLEYRCEIFRSEPIDILLLKDVPKIGKAGEVKKISDGYARNYILPQKLGVVATPDAVKQVEHVKKVEEKKRADALAEAHALATKLESAILKFRAKVGEGDKLFGSITPADIAERLQSEHKVAVDKRKVELGEPIKTLGEHRITVKLHPEVSAHIAVRVEKA